VDGQVMPLPVFDDTHGRIVDNIAVRLKKDLAAKKPGARVCRNVPIVVPHEETVLRVPLAVLLTHPPLGADIVHIIVDVLPDEGSLAHHRRRLGSFRILTDLQELWVVDSTRRGVEIWSALKFSFDDLNWNGKLFMNSTLSGIATYMAVDDIYHGTGL
jgi:hypothetical protein